MATTVHTLQSEAGGPPLAPIKSTPISFTCSQCHHMQCNSLLQYTEVGAELKGDCFCDHCGFRIMKLGRAETFFSMSSQKTEPEMNNYYGERPQESRKYNDRTFTMRLHTIASGGGRATSTPSHQRASSLSHMYQTDDTSGPAGDANTELESAIQTLVDDRSGHIDEPTFTESPTMPVTHAKHGKQAPHSLRQKVVTFFTTPFQAGKRLRTANTDHDQRATDASKFFRTRAWKRMRKFYSIRATEAANQDASAPHDVTPVAVTEEHGPPGNDVVLTTVQYNETLPPHDAVADDRRGEQLEDTDRNPPVPNEERLEARRAELTAAARAYGLPLSAIPQNRIYEIAQQLVDSGLSGAAPVSQADLTSLLREMTGGADTSSTPPRLSFYISDVGSRDGSQTHLQASSAGSRPSSRTDRRPSDSTSATLWEGSSSHRGSSRGHNRRSGQSTLGRSPLASSPEQTPSSPSESSSGMSSPSHRSSGPDLTINTSQGLLNDHVEEEDEDDGGPTPRAERGQGIPIEPRDGTRQSISSILSETQQRLESGSPTAGRS